MKRVRGNLCRTVKGKFTKCRGKSTTHRRKAKKRRR